MKTPTYIQSKTIFHLICITLCFIFTACSMDAVSRPPIQKPTPTLIPKASPQTIKKPASSELENEQDLWQVLRNSFQLAEREDKQIKAMEDFYLQRPKTLQRILKNATLYLPFVVEELQLRGMPGELALIPIVESYYDPRAHATHGHAGLWQLSTATAKSLHLLQNEWIDERFDAIASSRAALNYLLYLHRRFADWHLAIVAYNWGEGSLDQSLQKAHQFWRDRSAEMPTDPIAAINLPSITRNYLARIQALENILSQPQHFGLRLPPASTLSTLKRVRVPRAFALQDAARLSAMSLTEVEALNPAYLQQQVIQRHDEHNLLLPRQHADLLLQNLHTSTDTTQSQTAAAPIPKPRLHIVRAGETLGSIALRHQVSVKALRLANALPARMLTLQIGQQLKIPDNQQLANQPPEQSRQTQVKTKAQPKKYLVRRGDTLSTIAARHKVSLKALLQANRLSAKNTRLKIGQQLTLPNNAQISATKSTQKSRTRSYTVRKGDTLSTIAARHKISLKALLQSNRLSAKKTRLKIGQKLKIPPQPPKKRKP